MSRYHITRQEFQDYLPLTQRLQSDLWEDVDELQSQEGWDKATRDGVAEWLGDVGSIWRALRRYRYDEDKALSSLLAALSQRVLLSLHEPIPHSPLSNSPLFFFLPDFTDKLQRPVAVLSFREVKRDNDGKLDDIKEWIWWALELGRRVVRDHTTVPDGGGFILIIDAAGAGYRNMELELLPTLMSVGHDNFPGLIEAVYVVNAGWTHRNMWKVVKRVLPKSALEKVAFLDDKASLAEIFDIDQLPTMYGGNKSWKFENPVLQQYAKPVLKSSSCSSIADVYYSARTTPANSRPISRRASGSTHAPGLRMTQMMAEPSSSHPSSSSDTSLQRIKSLSDFHLYLSPSRLANIDLLSDSDDETPRPSRPQGIAARRARPQLKVKIRRPLVQSYSSQLQVHHAKGVEMYSKPTQPPPDEHPEPTNAVVAPNLPEATQLPEPEPETETLHTAEEPVSEATAPRLEMISAFSQDSNPWFGYPAIRISDTSNPGFTSIRPRYSRNRKRDLIKTLLFLFVLRLQSWRDSIERMLGFRSRGPAVKESVGPSEGLMRSASKGRGEVTRSLGFERDWIWMLVGFLLFRGSWSRVISVPLEAMGWESMKGMLGLT